jgi:hypothetical protein
MTCRIARAVCSVFIATRCQPFSTTVAWSRCRMAPRAYSSASHHHVPGLLPALHGKGSRQTALRPAPAREARRSGRTLRLEARVGSVTPGGCRTLFSMPLAYPSTLDLRPPAALPDVTPSYVEEFWSPSLGAFLEKAHAKADANSSICFQRNAQRVFLSQAGPRIGPRFSSSWASPFALVSFLASETTKATSRSPSLRSSMHVGV